jgi:hypothetical protein
MEMICRELRDRSANIGKDNLALLDPAQREKLKVLETQLPLMQVLSEAMTLRLLTPPAVAMPGNRVSGFIGSMPPTAGAVQWVDSNTFATPMIGGFGCAVPMAIDRVRPVPVRDPMPGPGMNRR